MEFDCESMKECLKEIAEAISVNVNVNVENNCATIGGSATLYCVNEDGDITINPPPGTQYPVLPIVPLPPGMETPPAFEVDENEPPPDGFDTWNEYNEKACLAANVLYDWSLKVLDRLIELVTEDIFQFAAVFAVIANLIIGGWPVVFSRGMILKLAELYARLVVNTDVFVVALLLARQNLIDNKSEYICALYQNRGNVADWENDLVTWIFEASSGGLDSLNERPYYLDLLRMFLPGLASVGIVYDSFTYNYPIEDGYDCADCEEPEPVWIPAYSTGYLGDTTLAVTADTVASFGGVVELYKASEYGAFEFYASLALPNGLSSNNISIAWETAGDNPGWRLDFFDANEEVILAERLSLPTTGSYQKIFSNGAELDVREVRLYRTADIYTAASPREFEFLLETNWVLA